MRDVVLTIFLGAAAGAATAAGAWALFATLLDRQFDRAAADMLTRGEMQLRRELETQLQARIPPMVRQAMDEKFREVGLTRQTGEQIARVLDTADRIGLIGLPRYIQ